MSNESLVTNLGLPKDVQFCKKCVISNQRPSSTVEFKSNSQTKKATIDFDEDGVCSACRYAEQKERHINWSAREEQLQKLCDKYRSKTGGYDVVKGERVKIQGYLEDFALSKEEADGLIMSARKIVYEN